MAGHAAPNIVEDGLVFLVDAANPRSYPRSGTTWFDIIGGYNGTLFNGTNFITDDNGVINFDGADDGVELPVALNVLFDDIDEFSLSMWAKINTEDGTGNRLFQAESTAAGGNWKFAFRNISNTIQFGTNTGGGSYPIVSSAYSFDVWYNIVGTFKASTSQKLYFNGVQVATDTPGALATSESNSKIRIGAGGDTLRTMDGQVANTLLYTKELSAQEIKQNYNALKGRFN
tara:strand:+ start:841 stop:1530 length:690 start_codon:yes stop_codon:yes gene_type:complete